MPTDQDDDAEISALLNQAEPPKSPAQLDSVILQYAREKAAESAQRQKSSVAWLSRDWLQQNWMSAAATFSVAAIAVSVSLLIFTESDLQTTSIGGRAELALSDTATASKLSSADVTLEAEEQARPSAAASFALSSRPPASAISSASSSTASPLSSPLPDAAPRSPTATELATEPQRAKRELANAGSQVAIARQAPNAVQSIDELDVRDAQSNPAAIELSAGIDDDLVAAVEINAASANSAVGNTSKATQEPPPNLAENLLNDAALQESVIIVLRRSLDVTEPSAIDRRQEFSLHINPLIETYRQLADLTILSNIQSRYTAARSEQLNSRLPETVEELVSLLETLTN